MSEVNDKRRTEEETDDRVLGQDVLELAGLGVGVLVSRLELAGEVVDDVAVGKRGSAGSGGRGAEGKSAPELGG